MGRFFDDDWKGLRKAITQGAAHFVGEGDGGWIALGDDDPVHIAIVYEVAGYGPHTAAIYADQNRYHASSEALQNAFEILEDWLINDYMAPEDIKELEDEWGDEWMEIATETFDGQTWTLSPEDALRAVKGTKAEKMFNIDEEIEEDDED